MVGCLNIWVDAVNQLAYLWLSVFSASVLLSSGSWSCSIGTFRQLDRVADLLLPDFDFVSEALQTNRVFAGWLRNVCVCVRARARAVCVCVFENDAWTCIISRWSSAWYCIPFSRLRMHFLTLLKPFYKTEQDLWKRTNFLFLWAFFPVNFRLVNS